MPFLVHGPGIEPESISDHVSLIDLPRTVAGLVGVAPHPGWMGRDLWGSAEPAPVFTFQTREVDRKSTRLNSSHVVISYAVFCSKK